MITSIRDCVHSGLSPFGIVSIWNHVHSGLYPFGMMSIRDGVHSGWYSFGIVSIWNGVHSGLCPFGIVSIWNYVFRDRAHSVNCPDTILIRSWEKNHGIAGDVVNTQQTFLWRPCAGLLQSAEQVLCGLPMRSPIRLGREGFRGPVQISFTQAWKWSQQATVMQASRWQHGFVQTYHYAGAVMISASLDSM